MHTHSLSTSTGLTIPQADVRGTLRAVSWAKLGQVTVSSGRTALPASWAQLWRVGEYECNYWTNSASAGDQNDPFTLAPCR